MPQGLPPLAKGRRVAGDESPAYPSRAAGIPKPGTLGDGTARFLISRPSPESAAAERRMGHPRICGSFWGWPPAPLLELLRTGLPGSVPTQVPKCEAPGPPIFSGSAHFSRHLGHPPPAVLGLTTRLLLELLGTGLPKSVPSQVPIFSGSAHFSRHLGHPPSLLGRLTIDKT